MECRIENSAECKIDGFCCDCKIGQMEAEVFQMRELLQAARQECNFATTENYHYKAEVSDLKKELQAAREENKKLSFNLHTSNEQNKVQESFFLDELGKGDMASTVIIERDAKIVITFICYECGVLVDSYIDHRKGDSIIQILPCPKCLEKAKEGG